MMTMYRLPRSLILAAATVAVAVAGSLPATVSLLRAAPAGAAGAATAVDCSAGVIVAVDFGHWEGATDAVCDTILPANAAYALVATGFDPTPVSSYGLDFICQIAGPGGVEYPQGENCSTTPPANAYWSFWYADAGQDSSWTYSTVGAMSLVPEKGSVEAWVFGGQNAQPPGLASPQTIRAATTQSVTGTDPTGSTSTTLPSSGPPSGPSSESNPAPAPPGPTPAPATASAPSAAAATTSTTAPTHSKLSPSPGQAASTAGHTSPSAHYAPASGATSTSRSGDDGRIISAVPAVAARQPSSGPSTSFLVGAGVIVLLLAVAGTVTWARRRERPEEL